jgi:hypothetical protein
VHTLDAPPVLLGLEWRDHVLSRLEHAQVITDDNMIPEWRGAGEASFPPSVHR